MPYSNQKKYFENTYEKGLDVWSHIPKDISSLGFIKNLPKESFILDLGSGRGFWPFSLAENGYRVIGLDFVKSVVDKNNYEVKNRGLLGRIRFVEGDALDIPFVDEGFDAIIDFGLLQHLRKEDWQRYKNELLRVLKKDGILSITALSRETKNFLGWTPYVSNGGSFEKDGVFYNFFSKEEVADIFSDSFELLSQSVDHLKDDGVFFVTSVFKKK